MFVWGLGFRVEGLGCRVWGLGLRVVFPEYSASGVVTAAETPTKSAAGV